MEVETASWRIWRSCSNALALRANALLLKPQMCECSGSDYSLVRHGRETQQPLAGRSDGSCEPGYLRLGRLSLHSHTLRPGRHPSRPRESAIRHARCRAEYAFEVPILTGRECPTGVRLFLSAVPRQNAIRVQKTSLARERGRHFDYNFRLGRSCSVAEEQTNDASMRSVRVSRDTSPFSYLR